MASLTTHPHTRPASLGWRRSLAKYAALAGGTSSLSAQPPASGGPQVVRESSPVRRDEFTRYVQAMPLAAPAFRRRRAQV
jgi:hypothetical protein